MAFVADFGTQNFNLKNKFDMENNTLTNHENGNDANRLLAAAVKSDWDLRKFFEQMRFDKNHHLGLGDIRLTMAQQEEICELVERFYRCH